MILLLLWNDLQEEKYFLYIHQLNGKYPRILSQMTTYWFVIAWFDNQSVQKSKVRQAAKDIVKSEIYSQTYSS